MSSVMPVSKQRHGKKLWHRFSSYSFAEKEALAPLALAELPKAATALPIAFILQNGSYLPAALMGFQAGRNLAVSSTGDWLARYIPAAYRSYPFRLLDTDDGQQVMCVDEGSGLLTDDLSGERFFGEDEQPSKAIADILNFLNQTSMSRKAAISVGAVLQRHSLIRPWPLTVQGASGDQRIEGLFQIDEPALNKLDAQALLELRDEGALLVAYLQLLSMQNLSELARLASERGTPQSSPPASGGTGTGRQGETFSFGNLS